MIIPGYFSINEDDIILKEALFKCDEIFKNIMYLASSININSSLSLCNLYLYLLYSGNLSINKTFIQKSDNIINDGAINLILGYGCCRNISAGLKELLDKNKIENYILTTQIKQNLIIFRYDPLFNKKVISNISLNNLFKKDYSSLHELNLIIDKDKCFCYDATWGFILKLCNNNLKMINSSGKMKILHFERNFMDYCYKETEKTKQYLKELKRLNCYTNQEFKNTFKEDLIKFKNNDKLIKSFYDDNYEKMDFICKTLRKNHKF